MNLTRNKMVVLLAGTAMTFAIGGVGPAFGEEVEKSASQYPPDNTGRNVRDAKGGTVTPEDQSESEADRKLTQRVRQAIMDDQALSMVAQNVKVISINGKVTLRGPVKTESEKLTIANKARRIAGLENVDDQLEVIPK